MDFRNDVEEKIKSGVYKLTTNRGRHSPIWKMYAVIAKEDGSLVDGLVYCRECKKLLKFDGKRSSNLNRHNCFLKSSLRECDSSDKEDLKNISTTSQPGFFATDREKDLIEDVVSKLKSGEYKLVHRPKGKSAIWSVFERICQTNSGMIVEGLVHCSLCKKFYKFDGSLTANLGRHKCFLDWKHQETPPKRPRIEEDHGLSLSSTLTEESNCSTNSSMEREEQEMESVNFSFEMDLIQKNVESKIQSGIYKLTDSQMTTSPIWSSFGFITKDDGSILEGLVCCRQCKVVLKYNGTSLEHLNRHKCFALDTLTTVSLDLVKEEFIDDDYTYTEFSEFRPNRPIEIKEEPAPLQGATYTCLTNSLDECMTIGTIDESQITVLSNDPYAICIKKEAQEEEEEDITEPSTMRTNMSYIVEQREDAYATFVADSNYQSQASPFNEMERGLQNRDSTSIRQTIEDNIRSGLYRLIDKQNVRSTIWKMFALVAKEDGTIIDHWVYCRRCKKLLKNSEKSSSNLNRHPCCTNTLKKINDEDKQEVIKGCARWMIEDCRPVTGLEGAGFRKLVSMFIQVGARYGLDLDIDDLMPDATVVSQHLQQMATERKIEIKNKIEELTRDASVSLDYWSDNNVKKSFLSVTLHFCKDFELFVLNLGVKSLDFTKTNCETIQHKLKAVLNDFGITEAKNLIYVSEREDNIEKALEGKNRLNCSSHLFAQVLDKAIENTPELKEIIKASKVLVKMLRKSADQRPLLAMASTCCKSQYGLFKLIADNWTAAKDILEAPSSSESLEISPDLASSLQSLVDLCKKCELIFKRLQESRLPSLCFVIPSINRLKMICENTAKDLKEIAALKGNLLKYLEEIWVRNTNIWHKTAYFLYPPTNQEQEEHLNEIKEFCIKQMKPLLSATPQDKELSSTLSAAESSDNSEKDIKPTNQARAEIDFFFPNIPKRSALSNNAEEEVRRYCRENVIIDENFDVCQWWSNNASSYPLLSRLFSQILAIPASTTGMERCISSLSSNIIEEKRKGLRPKSVDNILFLNSMGQNEL